MDNIPGEKYLERVTQTHISIICITYVQSCFDSMLRICLHLGKCRQQYKHNLHILENCSFNNYEWRVEYLVEIKQNKNDRSKKNTCIYLMSFDIYYISFVSSEHEYVPVLSHERDWHKAVALKFLDKVLRIYQWLGIFLWRSCEIWGCWKHLFKRTTLHALRWYITVQTWQNRIVA